MAREGVWERVVCMERGRCGHSTVPIEGGGGAREMECFSGGGALLPLVCDVAHHGLVVAFRGHGTARTTGSRRPVVATARRKMFKCSGDADGG